MLDQLSIVLFWSSLLLAEKPPVEDLGNGHYRIGQVTFKETSREISFPAEINMTEGLLEYAIVHEKGKIHESLLLTNTSALNINIALKLLRYQESPELFPILNENYESTGKFPELPESQKTAARLRILLSWNFGGKSHQHSLNELIYHTTTEKPMSPKPWIYQGSYLHEGKFKAETSGDYAAIYITRSSLFNFSGDDNGNDEVWIPNPKLTPPVGTKITVTLAPLLDHSQNNKP
ncbi:MAG: YdjY domain-containing protein [Verrucomicrobiota bacterium]